MILLFKYLRQRRILIFRGQSRNNRHGLGAIVRLPLIAGGAIGGTCPELRVETTFYATHHLGDLIGILILAELQGEGSLRFQGQIIPAIGQYTHIDVLAPVAPTPSALTLDHQATLIDLPDLVQVTAHPVVYHRNETTVGTIIILCIKTVPTDRRQHL